MSEIGISELGAIAFSRMWEEAWNRRDAEAVLAHCHDDIVFTSPVAQRIGFAPDGVVSGKQELRRYWLAALARNPNLHFQVTSVFLGIDTLVIAFRNQDGEDRVEVLVFRDKLVVDGRGTFVTHQRPKAEG